MYKCQLCDTIFKSKLHFDIHSKRINTLGLLCKPVQHKIQKPFLKWVGGKTQIINNILEKFPKTMSNYHELFLGGGSVLLGLLSLVKQNKIIVTNTIYAYDVNQQLINLYSHIQKNKDELFNYIHLYITEYESIQRFNVNVDEPPNKPENKKSEDYKIWINSQNYKNYKKEKERKRYSESESKASKENYYYWIRNKYNKIDKSTVECSALFMFLNKICFRGVFREGPNGFNVPFGNYKKTPTIISKTDLDYISDLIQNVKFICSDFKNSIKNINIGDFAYLDPPYAQSGEKYSFVGYVIDGFNLDNHIQLFREINILKEKNIKFTLSNAKVKLVTDNFKDCYCEEIIARRAINSKNPDEITTEVIIYN